MWQLCVFVNRLRSTQINCPQHRQTCKSGELELWIAIALANWDGIWPQGTVPSAAGHFQMDLWTSEPASEQASERERERAQAGGRVWSPTPRLGALALQALPAFHPSSEGLWRVQCAGRLRTVRTGQTQFKLTLQRPEWGKALANSLRGSKSLLPWQDAFCDV